MPYHRSEYRPPLPPRSPRPQPVTSPVQGSGFSSFPPPPPGPPPRVSIPDGAPPVPPRPAGFPVSPVSAGGFSPGFPGSPASAGGYQAPSLPSSPGLAPPGSGNVNYGGSGYMSFPPPPVSPNRLHSRTHSGQPSVPPPLPPRPVSFVPGAAQAPQPGSSTRPTALPLSPGAQSPYQLTSFPPPPPGPPPTQATSYPPYSSPGPSSQGISDAAFPPHQETPPGGFQPKVPLPPDPSVDPEIPSFPPPAYTPFPEPSVHIPAPPASPGPPPATDSPLTEVSPIETSSVVSLPAVISPPSEASPTPPAPYPPAGSPPVVSPVSSPPLLTPTAPFPVKPEGDFATGSLTHPAEIPVSNPGASDALSFFPRVSPMPRDDPIEELFQSMGLDSTSSTDFPSSYPTDGASLPVSSSPPLPSQSQNSKPRPEFKDTTVPPLRPAKIPLPNQPQENAASHSSFDAFSSYSHAVPLQHSIGLSSHGDDSIHRPLSVIHAGTGPPLNITGNPRPASIAEVINYGAHENEHARPNIYTGHDSESKDAGVSSPEQAINGNSSTQTHSYTSPSHWARLPVPPSCIDIPVTFATTWYYHPATPEFFICSRCFTDLIASTQFRQLFQSLTSAIGNRRHCRFSKPMMKDHIWKNAVLTNCLQPAIDWMRLRATIPDCRGVDGVKGDTGIKWYSAVNDSIPGFLLCQACYEDHALTNPLASYFQPHPQAQGAKDHWACDMAIPFIQQQYEADGSTGHWSNFAFEAKSRLVIPRCAQQVAVKAHGKKWFGPVHGPTGLILCAACYCDQVIHTGEEPRWQVVPGLTDARDKQVRCAMGRFNIRMAMARAHEVRDFSIFWTAIQKLEEHPLCADSGTQDDNVTWWTLPGDPSGFQVCGACYVAIAEPLGVSQFFEQKQGIPQGTILQCCFNLAHPRLRYYMPRLLEAYFTHNPMSLIQYATTYGSIKPCAREVELVGARWYGWSECTICPECYLSFARQHNALVMQMPLQHTLIDNPTMCEMYSPRMRGLYAEAASRTPPNPTDLLHHAQLRRQTYHATVPQMRRLISQQKLALGQQQMLNTLSTFHTNSGQLQQIAYSTTHTYSAPGVGGGFANMDALQGAAYGQQAMGITAGAQGALGMVRNLEQQWRAVE